MFATELVLPDRTRTGETGVIELIKTVAAGPVGSDFRLPRDFYVDSSVLAMNQYPASRIYGLSSWAWYTMMQWIMSPHKDSREIR